MKYLALIVAVLALVFCATCIEGWLLMLIVNWVASLFGAAFTLTFWQSFGICVLLSFIGGFFKSSSSKK
jgi:hypothetical protein